MSETVITQILTRSYPVMPQELEILAERIREIEGFYVNLNFLQKPRSESEISPGRYDYERAASSKMNIGKWIEKRFEPRFPFLKAQVITSDGRPAFDDELLSYVRGANAPWLGELKIKVESKKDTPEEKNADLVKLKRAFAPFEIFSQRELVDEAWSFLRIFKGTITSLT